MTPIFLTKQEMQAMWEQPYFGYTTIPGGIGSGAQVFLRNDLPPRVLTSVKAHELQHAKDNAFLDGRVWHWEMRAWWAGFRADWRGFFQAIWMSVTDRERLILYWKRFTQGF